MQNTLPATPSASKDPAPALTRGLVLLDRLSREGACSLERLATATRWPKSSVLRLLCVLAASGAATQEPGTKRWRALKHLVRFDDRELDLRDRCAPAIIRLSREVGMTVELYALIGERLTMIDRCDADIGEVRVRARIGASWELAQLDAHVLAALAFGIPRESWPKARWWRFEAGRREPLTVEAVEKLVEQARRRGWTQSHAPNDNNVIRCAVPVLDEAGTFLAVLAVPLACPADAPPARRVAATCDRLATRLRVP